MENKLEYLADSFSRTTKKKFEHYVITSIYQKIGNYELKPVTQQLVYSNTNANKYYYLDLYFPQINYGVEVDEPAHQREEYKASDLKRAEDILLAIKCKEEHVVIEESSSLEDINKQIDRIVDDVKKTINKLPNPLEWLSNEKLMEKAFQEKKISALDDIDFKNYTTIWEKFSGIKLERNRKCYAKTRKLPGGYVLWVPKAKITIDGKTYGSKDWDNIINEDKTVLTEKGSRRKPLTVGMVNNGEKRAVFMHIRNEFKRDKVIFMGLFQHVENTTPDTAVYRKIADEYIW